MQMIIDRNWPAGWGWNGTNQNKYSTSLANFKILEIFPRTSFLLLEDFVLRGNGGSLLGRGKDDKGEGWSIKRENC